MRACVCVHLAAELILHGEVNKPDTRRDEGVDEPDCVQPCLELRRYHAHEDLPTEGLDAVIALRALSYALWTHKGGEERS